MRSIKEEVYAYVKTIPNGKVATYGQVAEALGDKRLARVVGNVLHKNPDPNNIPCHRVVNGKGQISENYAFGGTTAQRSRLEAEGICFEKNGTIDLRKYGM